ncbi:hypothetical protein, partial [Legionella tunisiensis]|uniref:hypothetical protein n=1 Tax=Legionella tunisiensis TaxID=1034944 RepID=UPI0012EA9F67
MLEKNSCCEIIKDIILVLIGGIIALGTSIITSCINNEHDEKMQNNRNAFSFIKEYNENLLEIISCRRTILDTASKLGRSLDIEPKSAKATESLRKYSSSFENCYSSLLKMKLISNAINLSTRGIDCALKRITTLNKE